MAADSELQRLRALRQRMQDLRDKADQLLRMGCRYTAALQRQIGRRRDDMGPPRSGRERRSGRDRRTSVTLEGSPAR